jgi:hypothetical protein
VAQPKALLWIFAAAPDPAGALRFFSRRDNSLGYRATAKVDEMRPAERGATAELVATRLLGWAGIAGRIASIINAGTLLVLFADEQRDPG